MSTPAAQLRPIPALPAIMSLAKRELVRFFRQRNRVIGALVQPILFWLLFSEGLKGQNLGYGHFFPGTLAMIVMFTAIFATISIIEDRNEGFLQGVLVAPAPRWTMVLGKVLGGATIALVQAVAFLILGRLTGASGATPGDMLMATVVLAVMSVALTSLGFFIAWRMDSSQGFHAIMSVFLLPMWLLSGAFFRQGADGLLGWIVAVNPLTYGVAALRRYVEHANGIDQFANDVIPGTPSLMLAWIVSIAFAVAMFAAAWRIATPRRAMDAHG